jgi:beta-glucosidase-like glycosyl hydrolase
MAQPLFKTLSPLAIVGIEGTSLAPRERELLCEAPPAGIIVFARNVEGGRQLAGLIAEIEGVFAAAGARPPIIAADHEGGIVSVLARAIGTPPSQMAAGLAGAPFARRLYEENALRMRACGVNMMLGPVADVNSERLNPIIGTRSFGESVETVSACVREAVAGAKAAGLLTCLKHFPGHGPTRADSHVVLPVLGATLDELRKKDLVPFVRGIEAGADSVMVAHVVPAGRTLPASLDREIVTGVLREELGFGGVIMTDALEMAGARTGASEGAARPLAESCEAALRAGNDILLFSSPVAKVAEELDAGGAAGERSGFWRDELAGRLAISGVRIDGLTAIIKKQSKSAASQLFDDDVYRGIARRSVRDAGGTGGITPASVRPDLEVAFWSEGDLFRRPPVQNFIEQVVTGLSRGGRALSPLGADKSLATSSMESIVYSSAPGASEVSRVVFLMNRRPLEAAAVRGLCARADAVVVAEWPYAADLLEPDMRLIVTYGVYDTAAELVCSKLLSRPSC